jgi:hypothetical protein
MRVIQQLVVEMTAADIRQIVEERVREVMREKGYLLLAPTTPHQELPSLTFEGEAKVWPVAQESSS